ncbi:unnamed protein product [Prorocentrum cordatum]|uniref:Uncharacterized protein n=1 Tax=Prorocentrum cordatum TaxID=2364126 RepID=A0ABN9PI77_9DINO|nr:unnamed protein product [Polarella glacialis]
MGAAEEHSRAAERWWNDQNAIFYKHAGPKNVLALDDVLSRLAKDVYSHELCHVRARSVFEGLAGSLAGLPVSMLPRLRQWLEKAVAEEQQERVRESRAMVFEDDRQKKQASLERTGVEEARQHVEAERREADRREAEARRREAERQEEAAQAARQEAERAARREAARREAERARNLEAKRKAEEAAAAAAAAASLAREQRRRQAAEEDRREAPPRDAAGSAVPSPGGQGEVASHDRGREAAGRPPAEAEGGFPGGAAVGAALRGRGRRRRSRGCCHRCHLDGIL